MKFFRVTSGFAHVQDCLTREKAERLAERIRIKGWFQKTAMITPGEIERDYPHFDPEDLKTVNSDPVYKENLAEFIPFLNMGAADPIACARLWREE